MADDAIISGSRTSKFKTVLVYIIGLVVLVGILFLVDTYYNDGDFFGKAIKVYTKSAEGEDVLHVIITFENNEKATDFTHKDVKYTVSFEKVDENGALVGLGVIAKTPEPADVPECTKDTEEADCKQGYECTAEKCTKKQMSCDVDADCPGLYICDGGDASEEGYQGACTPEIIPCDETNPCEAGKTCSDGQCIPAASGCNVDADCAAGETCMGGECVAPSGPPTICGNDLCEAGETLSNCQADCYVDFKVAGIDQGKGGNNIVLNGLFLEKFGTLCIQNLGTADYTGTLEIETSTLDSKDCGAAKVVDSFTFTVPETTYTADGPCVDVSSYYTPLEYYEALLNSDKVIPFTVKIDPNEMLSESNENNNGYRTYIQLIIQ